MLLDLLSKALKDVLHNGLHVEIIEKRSIIGGTGSRVITAKVFVENEKKLIDMEAENKELKEENMNLRKLFICPNPLCKTDRYKQLNCNICGAKYESN